MKDIARDVQALIDKAVQAQKSEDALRFSQAALNAANAALVVISAIGPSNDQIR